MAFIKSLVLGWAVLMGAITLGQDVIAPGTPLAPSVATTGGGQDVAAPADNGANPLTKSDLDAWLDGYLPYALSSGDIPGAVVTVVKDGQILTARGYGYADVEKRTPVIPDRTLFRPGSVSKLVTWTAVMQQVEKGKIDLDGDVNTYLDFKIPPRNGEPVTMRQLMTHTAGFEERAKYLISTDPEKMMSLGDYLKSWVPDRIFDAGTTPAYSNWATTLAGYIVERVSGVPFNDYVDSNIFKPLGMNHSTFRQPLPDRLKGDMASGYTLGSGEPVGFENVGPFPAGSLSSTGTDMARFMMAQLQGGELDGNRIMSAQTAEQMHNTPLTVVPPLNRMELGFFETNTNGRQVIGHLGDLQGFHTSLHLFMNEDTGFYISFNGAGRQGAVGTLRNAIFTDFADRYFPGKPTDGRVDAKTVRQHAEMMSGLWRNSRRSESNFMAAIGFLGQSEVSVGPKGELVIPSLQGKGGAQRQWVEISPFVWRDRDSQDRIAAVVKDGKIVRWSMDQVSPFMVFDRVPAAVASTWIKPALYISLGVLALTFLLWPVAAVVRRNYASQLAVTGRARTAYRATRISAGLVLAVVIGWVVLITSLLSKASNLSDAANGWLWLLQIVGLIVFVGAVIVSGWNALLSWQDGRRWTAKLWNTLTFLSALMVLYFAYAFGLLAMSVNY